MGLGDHTGLECQLGHLEGRSVCHAADGEHGDHDTGDVQKNPESPKGTEGFCSTFTRSVPSPSSSSHIDMISDWFQDKEWEIVDFSKSKIDQFKRIIPLIADLKNPAMRDRY